MIIGKADDKVHNLIKSLKEKNHQPRLEEAQITLIFTDDKPFIKDRFNWGKVQKLSPMVKCLQRGNDDFAITLPVDGWIDVMNESQREAWLDLHLTRCRLEYVPVTIKENGKVKPIKDEWGRIEYSDEAKRDKDGNPKWKVSPLDLETFAENIHRYGLWCEPITLFKDAITKEKNG
jgi:hypothetical protein